MVNYHLREDVLELFFQASYKQIQEKGVISLMSFMFQVVVRGGWPTKANHACRSQLYCFFLEKRHLLRWYHTSPLKISMQPEKGPCFCYSGIVSFQPSIFWGDMDFQGVGSQGYYVQKTSNQTKQDNKFPWEVRRWISSGGFKHFGNFYQYTPEN